MAQFVDWDLTELQAACQILESLNPISRDPYLWRK